MTLDQLALAVKDMRDAQKRYFLLRGKYNKLTSSQLECDAALAHSKDCERAVDKMILDYANRNQEVLL